MPPKTNNQNQTPTTITAARPKNNWLKKHKWGLAGLVVIVLAAGWSLTHLTTIRDWYILANYKPPQTIATLAQQDNMTSYGRELFYVNKPQLDSRSSFAQHCPNGSDQAYVIGCYHSGDNGIFLLDVTDSNLQGIKPVTAAYEMLHAAYARFSGSMKRKLDKQMWAFYQAHITSPIIRSQMSVYAKTEPGEGYDELFSVLGTEVGNLPTYLQKYYQPYFSNRRAIINMYNHYQAAFTSRIDAVNHDDALLKQQKATIDGQESQITALKTNINAMTASLNQELSAGQFTSYNATVNSYNSLVRQYNALVDQVDNEVNSYNALVKQRNSQALEEQNLVQAISTKPLPDQLK